MITDSMKYLNITQKYNGLTEKTVSFLTRNQLLDRKTWAKFVDQFRHPIDGGNNGWRGEYWGKMMRGAVLVYQYSGNAELYAVLGETVRDMLSVIDAEGRVSSFTKETEFRAWDLWCRKYVILGMEYFIEICREDALKNEIVTFISRAADYIIDRIGEGEGKIEINKATNHWLGLNSSSILEPMVRLYSLTGEQKYFDFCEYIVSRGGSEINVFERAYENVLKPYQYGVSKAYEMMSCFEGLLEFYRITGIEKYKTAVVNFAKAIIETEVSVIGSCGCTHELFDHTKARQTQFYDGIMQETCVTVTWMKFCSQLLRLTGESVFADEIEYSFYNAYLGALNENMIAPEDEYIIKRFEKIGKTDKMVVTPLPFDSYSPLIPGKRGRKVGGFQILADNTYYGCCVCIGAAGVGIFAKHAVLDADGAVAVNFYESGENEIVTEHGKISIKTDTKYPADGKITLKISSDHDFDLKLRIPAWSRNTKVTPKAKVKDGYALISLGAGESEIALELDMSIRETLPEKWDLDVLFINTCGTMRPPVPVRHYDEDDNYISLSRGPLTLAADSSLGHDAKSNFSFKNYNYRVCEDKNSIVKCEFTDANGEKFYLIDYQSAGKDWESDIAAWLPTCGNEK